MKLKDYLLWGGVAAGVWWVFFRAKKAHAIPEGMTPEEVVAAAVGAKTPTLAEQSLSQVNAKAVSDWKAAYGIAFPNDTITQAYLNGELVCIKAMTATNQAVGACTTLMDALTLGINELMSLAASERKTATASN